MQKLRSVNTPMSSKENIWTLFFSKLKRLIRLRNGVCFCCYKSFVLCLSLPRSCPPIESESKSEKGKVNIKLEKDYTKDETHYLIQILLHHPTEHTWFLPHYRQPRSLPVRESRAYLERCTSSLRNYTSHSRQCIARRGKKERNSLDIPESQFNVHA